jgi:TMEM175 potassium channel family protein
VNGFLWEALPQIVIYAASFMVIGTCWVRHHRMFDMCRVVDGGSLVLNLVFLGFVSLLTFPSDLLYFDDQSTSAVIAFSAVAGAATLCEVGLWRHLRRHRSYCCPTYQKNASRR